MFSVHMCLAFGTSERVEAFCLNRTDSCLALPVLPMFTYVFYNKPHGRESFR